MREWDDSLSRFLLHGAGVRGEHVRLESTWQTLRARHPYPPGVSQLLGEALAASALLAATIKFDGSLSLQANSAGPLSLLMVEATSKRTLRGLARWRGPVPTGAPLSRLFTRGRLAITVDPGEGKDRYQGIIGVEGATLAAAIEGYFRQSEQLPTRLWLAVDEHCAAGLLLQQIPPTGSAQPGMDEDDRFVSWLRSVRLADAVTADELLRLGTPDLAGRLFHPEPVRWLDAQRWAFRCQCSQERVATMLRALGDEEVQDILRTEGRVSVKCEFCNAAYEFDAVDVAKLFADGQHHDPGPTRH